MDVQKLFRFEGKTEMRSVNSKSFGKLVEGLESVRISPVVFTGDEVLFLVKADVNKFDFVKLWEECVLGSSDKEGNND